MATEKIADSRESIWNDHDHGNSFDRLLSTMFPGLDAEAEMLKLTPEQLESVQTFADSMLECLIEQQSALADLMANADPLNVDRYTMRNASWLVREVSHLQAFCSRASALANTYADPESHAIYSGMASKRLETRQ